MAAGERGGARPWAPPLLARAAWWVRLAAARKRGAQCSDVDAPTTPSRQSGPDLCAPHRLKLLCATGCTTHKMIVQEAATYPCLFDKNVQNV